MDSQPPLPCWRKTAPRRPCPNLDCWPSPKLNHPSDICPFVRQENRFEQEGKRVKARKATGRGSKSLPVKTTKPERMELVNWSVKAQKASFTWNV